MKIIWRLVLLSLVLLLPTSLHAFETSEDGHGGITRNALSMISVTINGETLGFTDAAKEEIRAANVAVDWHQLTPEFHFDNETFFASGDRIRYSKEDLILRRSLVMAKEHARH